MICEGQIQQNEVSYVYHLVELFLTAIKQGGLTAERSTPNCPEVRL